MNHRTDIRTSAVNLGVDKSLPRRLQLTLDQLPFKVDHHDLRRPHLVQSTTLVMHVTGQDADKILLWNPFANMTQGERENPLVGQDTHS